MLKLIHWVIVATYIVLPAAALAYAVAQFARKQRGTLGNLITTFIAALALGAAMSLVYAAALGGRVVISQVLIAGYFAAGMLLLLKGFDAAVRFALRQVLRVPNRQALRQPPEPLSRWVMARAAVASLLRVAVVATIGLPYVMSSVMTYRPKVHPRETPQTQLGFPFERVTFRSTDGVDLVGWWVPALAPPRNQRQGAVRADWGQSTVIVCHGLAASKSNQLLMARQLVPAGYNVLAFDFRAHGESGGQLSTFGKLEVNDVLGAVRWVRANRAQKAQKIFGVGASMGGSALIAAAADDSDEGRAIGAVATYAAYDSLDGLTESVTRNYFVRPLPWLLRNIGVPLASAQTGADLRDFNPADRAADLWPRPLLLIHGALDSIIPFEHARILYNRASQPKYYLWIESGEHNDVLTSEGAARVVLRFFDTARPAPVI